jgi:hypothetical protein
MLFNVIDGFSFNPMFGDHGCFAETGQEKEH